MKNKREIIESKYPPVNNEDLWLKDGKLYYSTSQGWVPLSEEPSITETYEQGKSSISYSGKDGQEHQIELSENVESDVTDVINNTFVTNSDSGNVIFTDDDNVNHTLVTTDGFNTLLANSSVQKITWQELKEKRDNGQLIAGSLYRITDYNCTTTQENTQSAGHQFDIVLLALSENKLAKEGWAMMHDNIYDVTFNDGVTKKCYLYGPFIERDEEVYNIVDVDTLLGLSFVSKEAIIINEETKTAITTNGSDIDSTELTEENLTYNYFQNSNLSAWKVWYCLDNDTARFAWADDGEEESIILNGSTIAIRYPQGDVDDFYAWQYEDLEETYIEYTKTATPKVGERTYDDTFEESALIIGVAGFGRGVIYRLIDEWGNDVCFDFKNIMGVGKYTSHQFDPNGTPIYSYLFTYIDDSDTIVDHSLSGNVKNNNIKGFSSNNELPLILFCIYSNQTEIKCNKTKFADGTVFSGPCTYNDTSVFPAEYPLPSDVRWYTKRTYRTPVSIQIPFGEYTRNLSLTHLVLTHNLPSQAPISAPPFPTLPSRGSESRLR